MMKSIFPLPDQRQKPEVRIRTITRNGALC
jgi:hypothetical protein